MKTETKTETKITNAEKRVILSAIREKIKIASDILSVATVEENYEDEVVIDAITDAALIIEIAYLNSLDDGGARILYPPKDGEAYRNGE